jgi:hypothetical protein
LLFTLFALFVAAAGGLRLTALRGQEVFVIRFLAFGCYLIPLAVLELYFRAQRAGTAGKLITAGVVSGMTLVMGLGIGGAMMGMWLPRVI